MDTNRYTRILCLLIWLLVVLHVAAEAFYLYWTFFWFDLLTHFLGGLWVSLAAVWLFFRSKNVLERLRTPLHVAAGAILAALLIGLVWELYEYVVWTQLGTGLPQNYTVDTLMDLLMDTLGGMVGTLLVLRFSRSMRASMQPAPAPVVTS